MQVSAILERVNHVQFTQQQAYMQVLQKARSTFHVLRATSAKFGSHVAK
jgi:hypothetical protein